MSDSIWARLSAIDCNDHIEKKGKFSYLAWTWAIDIVMKHYPNMNHWPGDDVVYPDGTMEVRHWVEIEGKERQMWLPVLNHQNKPIKEPDAFDINTARMRCLVKCLAVNFGLGHYIYAGESTPGPSPELEEKFEELKSLVANKKGWELRQFTETNQPYMDDLFNMAKDGHKTQFKSDVRALYGHTNDELKSTLAALEEAVGDPNSSYSCAEIMGELADLERAFTWKGMNEILRKQVEEKLAEEGWSE